MPWKIPKKISLLAVAILFLFTFFNLILDTPRTVPQRSVLCVSKPGLSLRTPLTSQRKQVLLSNVHSKRSHPNNSPSTSFHQHSYPCLVYIRTTFVPTWVFGFVSEKGVIFLSFYPFTQMRVCEKIFNYNSVVNFKSSIKFTHSLSTQDAL